MFVILGFVRSMCEALDLASVVHGLVVVNLLRD